MTFSGVMMRAPFAVAPPLNICSTMALKVLTTGGNEAVDWFGISLLWSQTVG